MLKIQEFVIVQINNIYYENLIDVINLKPELKGIIFNKEKCKKGKYKYYYSSILYEHCYVSC